MQKTGLILASLFMLSAVVLGAFGAHGLKDMISIDKLAIFKTGVFYQFIHALSILLLMIISKIFSLRLKKSMWFFVIGIIFFSGSLYILSIRDLLPFSVSFVGPITPIGGLFFILGWLFFALEIKKIK